MNVKQRGQLISCILSQLKFMAWSEKKAFDYGDTFFSLAYMNDQELHHIAKLCGVERNPSLGWHMNRRDILRSEMGSIPIWGANDAQKERRIRQEGQLYEEGLAMGASNPRRRRNPAPKKSAGTLLLLGVAGLLFYKWYKGNQTGG